ncbi:VWA domain-containing protein, partial [Halomonas almeriensis]|uniref:vWA domain-containing protein n=1 Tax=Halomonas almeriensis TaxID=308163 RepID=UPI0025B34594
MGRIAAFLAAATLATGPVMGADVARAQDARDAQEDVMIVFDGSNSMWGQIEGTAKIEIARDVMGNLLGSWADDRRVGLMAYGHRNRGDCSDIETLVEPGPGTAATIMERINAISPIGKTPLTTAVEQAAQGLAYTDRPATVVLISDGLESCNRDPCALSGTLEKGGVGFTTHVVGFGLGKNADAESLACIADRTGGQFLSAENASELSEALSRVSTAVAELEPAPEPEPEITVQGPDTAVAGSAFNVSWTPSFEPRDYVTIVPEGADEGVYRDYIRVKERSDGTLRAPSDAGLYELRYVSDASSETRGRASIEITEPEATVSTVDSTHAGSVFPVEWTGTVHPRDYVTIVPQGAEEGAYSDYIRVKDGAEGELRAPADPGLYEVRYVLAQGDRTLASTRIEITAPEVTVSAPDTALAGSEVAVEWTGTVHPRDYVTIVPQGAEEGAYSEYIRVKDGAAGRLKAPADTGLYEVRYMLAKGDRTLASTTIEVTEPEVTVSAPDNALAGASVDISWTGTVDPHDYVTIV